MLIGGEEKRAVAPSVINRSPSDLFSLLIQLLAGETRWLSPRRKIYSPRSLPAFGCNLPGSFSFFFFLFLFKLRGGCVVQQSDKKQLSSKSWEH